MRKKLPKIFLIVIFSSFLFCTPLPGQDWDWNPFANTYCADRLWGYDEYLYWKIKDSPKTVDLVKSGSKVILGGEKFKNDWRSGGQFALGFWFDESHCFGTEAIYFFLPTKSTSRTVQTNAEGFPLLTIPFFDVTIPGENFTFLSFPGFITGSATLKVINHMQGVELNALMPFSCGCGFDLSFLAGLRYWNFFEKLQFSTSSLIIDTPTAVFITEDKFYAQNNFYGGQVGLELNYTCNCFFFNFKGKVALGTMCEDAIIKGNLDTNLNDGLTTVQTFTGGIFALPTNIGHHKRSHFCAIPAADVKLGYQLTDCISFQLGYMFLYVSNVMRAATEIDRNINPTQSVAITGTPFLKPMGKQSPKARLKPGSFWAQGLTAGVSYTF